MTPEERLARLRELDRWTVRLHARKDAFPARRRISPLVVSFATIAAVVVVVALVFSAFGLGIRSVRQPAVPVPVTSSPGPTASPLPTPTGAATPDNGKVMPLGFTDAVSSDANQEKDVSPVGAISMPWALYSTVGHDDEVIPIAWFSGPGGDCGHHLGVSVEETETMVTIAALDSPARASACTANATSGAGVIRLKEALGGRTLLHAPLSQPQLAGALGAVDPVAQPDHVGSATCANLLDPSTIARLKGKGLVDGSAAFSAKMAAAPHQALHRFLAYGGMVCAWNDGWDNKLGYGYGPITAAQARSEIETLDTSTEYPYEHVKKSVVKGITYFTYDDGSKVRVAFGDGYWVSTFDNGGGDVLDELIANAPRL